jgi:hypothetical protein
MFHPDHDPTIDRGEPTVSPTLKYFSKYLKQIHQYSNSKQLFKARSKNCAEIPKQKEVLASSKPSKRKIKGEKKGSSKYSHPAPAFPALSMSIDEVDPHQQHRTYENQPEIQREEDELCPESSIKLKPSRLAKKLIYTNHYIKDKDIPGPGAYNLATTLAKPTFNRIYAEPLPAMFGSSSSPSYLKHTSATTLKKFDPPVIEHSIITKSSPKSALFFSIQRFNSTTAMRSMPGHRQVWSKPTSPFNQQYPPISDAVIQRWSSEAALSYKKGLRPPSLLRDRSQQRQNSPSF